MVCLGLTRRVIPIFYEYTRETITKLLEIVRDGKINSSAFPPIQFDIPNSATPKLPMDISIQLEALANIFSMNLGMTRGKDNAGKTKWWVKKIIPISPVVTLRTLAMANAVKHGRDTVNSDDMIFCTRFIDYT